MEPTRAVPRDIASTTVASRSSFFARSLIRRDDLKAERRVDTPKGRPRPDNAAYPRRRGHL